LGFYGKWNIPQRFADGFPANGPAHSGDQSSPVGTESSVEEPLSELLALHLNQGKISPGAGVAIEAFPCFFVDGDRFHVSVSEIKELGKSKEKAPGYKIG
jgi:hypothetical protein